MALQRVPSVWLKPIGVFASIFVFALFLTAALAQEQRAPQIGIIDMQRILRESSAVQTLSRNIETLRTTYQEETFKKEEAFRAADLELARARSDLDATEFGERRQKLEQQAAELQRESQERKKELDQIFAQGMAQVQQTLLQISQEIASERDLDLVLAKATVMLVRPDLEITDDALARLNRELPEVPFAALRETPSDG